MAKPSALPEKRPDTQKERDLMTTWPTMEGIALAEVQLMDREAEASSTILNKDARKLLAASTWAVETLPKLRALVSRWETCTRADSDIRETYYDAAQELAALLPKEE